MLHIAWTQLDDMKELTASGSKEKDDWEDNDAKEKKWMKKGYLNRKSCINQDNKVYLSKNKKNKSR